MLHSLDGGGAEHIVCDFARNMADKLSMAVVCLDSAGALVDTARELGVEVFVLNRRAGLDMSLPGKLAKVFKNFAPDVIHAHQYTPYMYSALAAAMARTGKIIFTEHGRHWPDNVSLKRRSFNRLLSLRRDRITAVCNFVAEAIKNNEGFARSDVKVIPNGVVCDNFYHDETGEIKKRLAMQFGFGASDPLCVQVARMHPVKDHATAIEAFAVVCKKIPNARLLLVGDGQLRSRLEAQVKKLSLESNVIFAGVRSEISEILSASDLYILSSLSEGASLSILEAMSASLAIAATDVGGNEELIAAGECGLLSPRRNSRAMAENIFTLLSDEKLRLRMGHAARRRVEKLYDQKLMHESFLALYYQMAEPDREVCRSSFAKI